MKGRCCALAVAALLVLGGCGGDEQSSPTGGEAKNNGGLDACAIVTRDDATRLFGKPASPYSGTPVLDPNMLGECLWTWDSDTSNHLLQFRIWNGERYYSAMPDSQPVDFAATGFIRSHPMAGVDVGWIQDGRTISLSYSTVGPDVPKAQTRVDAVKELAATVSSRM